MTNSNPQSNTYGEALNQLVTKLNSFDSLDWARLEKKIRYAALSIRPNRWTYNRVSEILTEFAPEEYFAFMTLSAQAGGVARLKALGATESVVSSMNELEIFSAYLEKVYGIAVRDEHDWRSVSVDLVSGPGRQPLVDVSILLLDDSSVSLKTTPRGLFNLVRSLTNRLEDVEPGLEDDAQIALEALKTSMERLKESSARLTRSVEIASEEVSSEAEG